MNLLEIETEFSKHWEPDWGSVFADELHYIQTLIEEHRPTHFLEIGTASGLSAGFTACFLEANGGTSLTSVDYQSVFFENPDKPCGFQIRDIYRGKDVEIDLRFGKSAPDVGDFGTTWQMAFVDGNHEHPWPILDTLAIWPFLDGSKTVIYHDLNLFMLEAKPTGIGPKYLFDQFPESARHVSTARHGNIFSVNLGMPKEQLEEIAVRAFWLPWTVPERLKGEPLEKIRHMLKTHYGPHVLAQFEECLLRAKPLGLLHRMKPLGLLHRIYGKLVRSDRMAARAIIAAWRAIRPRR